MQMVITGGAGFIGSHLCKYLLNKGHSVICIDNLSTGSNENLPSPSETREFKFIKHDITESIYLKEDIDCVLHLASPASPVDYHRLPIQTLKAGALGTLMALGLAKHKKAGFLLASTSEVYGDPLVHPQVETYWGNVNPIGPRAVYDEAKRFAEAMTMAYHRYHKVETRIVRIFNTYGERMRIEDGRAIPAFMSQALRGENVTVFGDGSQTRSVCYVSDLIDGIFRLMMSDYALPVNVGNPDEVTMLQLANEIVELTGSKSKIVFKELPQDDPKVRQPDITKARELLSWKAKIDRKEGLEATMVYFKRKLGVKA